MELSNIVKDNPIADLEELKKNIIEIKELMCSTYEDIIAIKDKISQSDCFWSTKSNELLKDSFISDYLSVEFDEISFNSVLKELNNMVNNYSVNNQDDAMQALPMNLIE